MKKVLLFVLIIPAVLLGALVIYLNRSHAKRVDRLRGCIERKLPEAKDKFGKQGMTLGDERIWIDWLDPEEYAFYPLLQNGVQVEDRVAIISTDQDHQVQGDGGCTLSDGKQ